MKIKFENAIFSVIDEKKRDDNTAYINTVQYDEKISAVKSAKLKKKRPQDYRLVRKYDVMTIAGKEKLIKPISDGIVLYYLKVDEMFDVLYTTHIAIGHGGRDRMVAELRHKYCNVTKESIMVFLSFCSYCQKKTT